MLGKRSWPAIGILAGILRPGITGSGPSPMGCKMHPPRGPKCYDQGGIGLGIVVALDNNNNNNNGGSKVEVLAKYAICGQFSTRSSPILVIRSPKNDMKNIDEGNKNNNCGSKFSGQVIMGDLDEEFTNYETCHGRVYYDDVDLSKINQNDAASKIPTMACSGSDFLSSCHLCKKELHGKDIYMYRGEKAFCSAECRKRQIVIEERREKCRSEGSVSSSPYTTRGQIFFSTGIVAA